MPVGSTLLALLRAIARLLCLFALQSLHSSLAGSLPRRLRWRLLRARRTCAAVTLGRGSILHSKPLPRLLVVVASADILLSVRRVNRQQ